MKGTFHGGKEVTLLRKYMTKISRTKRWNRHSING